MYTEEAYQKAKKRVKAKKSFYQHLMAFAIVNLFLMALNLITSPSVAWFIYPLLGWGVGLAFHYVEVFGIPGFDILSKEWEEKQLERELKQQDSASKILQTPTSNKPDKGLELKELRNNYDETDFV